MKWKEIVRLSATMQAIISLFMLIPTFLAAYWGEWLAFKAFLTTLILMGVYVSFISGFGRNWKAKNLIARDIYIFVTLTYINKLAFRSFTYSVCRRSHVRFHQRLYGNYERFFNNWFNQLTQH